MLSHYETAASGGAAAQEIAAIAGGRRKLYALQWSYAADPTNGSLAVESPSGTTIFKIDITKGGPGFINFNAGLEGALSGALIVTLADGSQTKQLSFQYD